MKNRKYNFVCFSILLFLACFTSCKKDYLSFDYNEGPIDGADIWQSDRHARGFLNNCYNGLSSRYDLGGGALLATGCDEAVSSILSNGINIINNGTWGSLKTFDDQYTNLYSRLRAVNIFLEQSPASFIFPSSDKPKLRGEAFFLRAFYHFELFKRYGPIVLANRSFSLTENVDFPRNTISEVISKISTDCDSAATNIEASWTMDWDDANKGRATKAAALALKSRTLLYAASAYYNTANDLVKWQQAAAAAKALIDLNKHSLLSAADFVNLWDYSSTTTRYNKEVIFATVATSTNTIESNNAPVGFNGGGGRTNPTQDLVDAFEMANGKLISDPTSGYNSSSPYTGRDKRFAQFIVYNGSTFKTGTLTRAVETFEGGLDKVLTNPNSTKTGYYLKKFLSPNATYNITGTASVRRPWVISRYAEILLNYAEALNEASGPVADVYTYINQVRARAAMPSLPPDLTQSQMRDRIRNERRIELCFEEHRFFDIRRWKLGETILNGPVRGINIIKSGTLLTYTPFVFENRVFTPKNYLYPISQSELNKAPKLQQNDGY